MSTYTQKALAAASALLLGVPTAALAGNVTLQGNCVKIGTSDRGTIGSQGNTAPGILYDSTCTSTFNPSYDYLTPGTPFEGWTIKGLDATGAIIFNHSNNNASYGPSNPVTGTNADYSGVSYRGVTFDNRAVWSGSTSNFNIEHDVRFNDNQHFVDINTRLEFLINVPTLYFGRFTDPDARAAAGDSSATLNVRGYAGGIPATNVVLSEALASKYALGLFTGQIGGVNSGVSAAWTTDPINYYNGVSDGDGDYTIGLGFMFSGINTGDIVNIQYAYIFGPSAFAAGSGAVAGGAGGATPSSFTVTDVGSASAPTTPSAPTVVSTSTVNNVSSSTAQSTTLPVVTVSLAEHGATETGGRQRINRHTTTNVTTPYVTTTVTTPVTTDTYSDGSTVVTNGTPVTTYNLTNSVETSHAYDDFYGRVDQLEVLDNINDGINGLLNHEPTAGKQRLRVFENNRFVQSYNADGYTADSKIFGGGFEVDVTKGWTLGGQYNRVNVNLNGVDSSTQQNKDHFGVFSELRGNTLTLNTNAAIANSNYKYNRNVEGVFNNAGETTGSEWWVSNRLYWHLHKAIKPFIGYTVWNNKRNAYVETGSIQSARTVEEFNQTSHVGEAGLKLETRFGGKKKDLFGVSVEGAYATDNSYGVTAEVDYKEMLIVEASHGVNNGVTNNSIAGKVKFRF
jgi:hypothetical protein